MTDQLECIWLYSHFLGEQFHIAEQLHEEKLCCVFGIVQRIGTSLQIIKRIRQ